MKIRRFITKHFSKEKYYSFWSKVINVSLNCIGMGIGGNYAASGESYALDYLKSKVVKDNLVLFDCGANVGDYTKLLFKKFPDASIHCFEPLEITYNKLVENVKNKSAILNNLGISDKVGENVIHYNATNLVLSSLYDRQMDSSKSLNNVSTIKLTTIDEYCKQNGIDHIDFLKMDVEGSEYDALLGAANMLKCNKIKAIQIEFGGCNIDARVFFRDFWNLLSEQYHIYRLIPNGLIKIEKYEGMLEIFFISNYLFINKNI